MDDDSLDDYLFLIKVDDSDYSEEEEGDFSDDDMFDTMSIIKEEVEDDIDDYLIDDLYEEVSWIKYM